MDKSLASPRLKTSGKAIKISGDAASWSQALSSIFVELEVEQLNPDLPPTGHFYHYPFVDLTLVRAITRGGSHRVIRSERLIRSSSHKNFFIGYMLAGTATLRQGGREALLEPGDLAILDSTREYSIEVQKTFDALWIHTPRFRLEGRLHALSEIMASKVEGHNGVGHVASELLRAALVEAPRLLPSEANRIANSLLDLIGLALGNRQTHKADAKPYQAAILRRVQESIEARLDDEELTSTAIAQEHRVCVRYLNKLFEREGISIARWIRLRRLERCRLDLEDASFAHRPINDIAYSHGFRTISHFNRLFKTQFGSSPRAFRESH